MMEEARARLAPFITEYTNRTVGGGGSNADYQFIELNQNQVAGTGLETLRQLDPEEKQQRWFEMVNRAGANGDGVYGSDPLQAFGQVGGTAVMLSDAWATLRPEDEETIGISKNKGLVLEAWARKELAENYRVAPSYEVYRRLNALRFLKYLNAAFQAYGKLKISGPVWAEQQVENKSASAIASRMHSAQISRVEKVYNNPDLYAADKEVRLKNAQDALAAVNANPTNIEAEERLHVALGALTLMESVKERAGDIKQIEAYKKANRRTQSSAELLEILKGAEIDVPGRIKLSTDKFTAKMFAPTGKLKYTSGSRGTGIEQLIAQGRDIGWASGAGLTPQQQQRMEQEGFVFDAESGLWIPT